MPLVVVWGSITPGRPSLVRAKLCDWLFLTSVVYPPFLPLVDYLHASEAFPGRRMSDNEAKAEHNEVRRGTGHGARRGQEGRPAEVTLASPGLPGAAGLPWGYLGAAAGTVCGAGSWQTLGAWGLRAGLVLSRRGRGLPERG